MGEQRVDRHLEAEQLRVFVRKLLADVRALETMLQQDMIEDGVWRIGAEQEIFIVDRTQRPAMTALKILEYITDPHFTTELGLFNLEFNLDPLLFRGDCLSCLERQINELLAKAKAAAQKCGSEILLIGILPTLRKTDLGLEQMTPKPRYFALDEALRRLRGGNDYELFLRGTDEIYLKHDSIMLEACNTSFQVHFQVGAKDFVRYYNVAQAVAGPVLAVAVNSPLLFGKSLWHETRIALFQQAMDTRYANPHMRESTPRVSFGNGWIRESVLEIFQEDIARFRALLGADIEEDPFEVLQQGGVPKLKALQMHNGTVYRWNRPCYGITNGKPHLRIENRMFPSGPTPADEIANAAFWLGLVNGLAAKYKDITKTFAFDDAKANFIAAARLGLKAPMAWLHNKTFPAPKLIEQQLVPLAREGLQQAGIDATDLERYLEIIKSRARHGQTGAEWMKRSFAALKCQSPVSEALDSLVVAALEHQEKSLPVHEWALAPRKTAGDKKHHYQRVEQFMTTDIFTVNQDETIDLVINVMSWRRIRHIPVEDENNRLVGLVNYRSLLELLKTGLAKERMSQPVSAIMQKNFLTVSPITPTLEAIALMRQKGETCLLVMHAGRLVGIVTQNDFMNIAGQLLETAMAEEARQHNGRFETI